MAAAAAAKIEAKEPSALTPPDMSQPVRLKYWKCSDTIGTLTSTTVYQDGDFNDGQVQGKCRALWFYPGSGFAVAVIEVGWRPNTLKQDTSYERVILMSGHGRELLT